MDSDLSVGQQYPTFERLVNSYGAKLWQLYQKNCLQHEIKNYCKLYWNDYTRQKIIYFTAYQHACLSSSQKTWSTSYPRKIWTKSSAAWSAVDLKLLLSTKRFHGESQLWSTGKIFGNEIALVCYIVGSFDHLIRETKRNTSTQILSVRHFEMGKFSEVPGWHFTSCVVPVSWVSLGGSHVSEAAPKLMYEEIDDGLLPERTHSCHFKQWELTVKTVFLSMTCSVKRWPQRWFISQSGESLNRRNFPQISQLTKSKVRLWALSVDFALIIYFCWSASSGRFVLVLFLV